MNPLTQGLLITFEGIDGSGKSTLATATYTHLEKKIPTLLTREPGGSGLGKELRTLLQEKKVARTAMAEYLLFAADRAQHFNETIMPALQEKKLVISDRLADSSIVYQGYAKNVDIAMIKTINTWAMNSVEPHLIIYPKIDSTTALERIEARGQKKTSFEQEPISFYNRLIEGFNTLYTNNPKVLTLDARQPLDTLIQQTITYIETWLKNYQLPQI